MSVEWSDVATHRPGIVGDDADPEVALEWWLCCSCGWDADRDRTGWVEHLRAALAAQDEAVKRG